MSATPPEALEHKHLFGLDVLRGVAAVLVLFHHFENQTGHPFYFRHAFLAVDFFFTLSGFVVALAYEHRLRTGMGFWSFARARFVRLYPMIFLGALLGAGVAVMMGQDVPLGLALLSQLTLVPLIAGGGTFFLLNAPHWSLLLEVGGNLVHAAGLRWLSTRRLATIIVLSGLALVVVAAKFGTLSVGWSSSNWWAGFPRLVFSYGLGVLLFRLHAARRLPCPPIPLPLTAALLAATLVGVSLAGHWIANVVFVMIVSPFIVVAAAAAPDGPSFPWLSWLPPLSYPLYAIHMPLVLVWARTTSMTLLWACAWAVGLILLSLAVERWYERLARKRLAEWLRGAVLRPRPAQVP